MCRNLIVVTGKVNIFLAIPQSLTWGTQPHLSAHFENPEINAFGMHLKVLLQTERLEMGNCSKIRLQWGFGD